MMDGVTRTKASHPGSYRAFKPVKPEVEEAKDSFAGPAWKKKALGAGLSAAFVTALSTAAEASTGGGSNFDGPLGKFLIVSSVAILGVCAFGLAVGAEDLDK